MIMDDNLSETPSATLDVHDGLYHQGVQKASKQRPVRRRNRYFREVVAPVTQISTAKLMRCEQLDKETRGAGCPCSAIPKPSNSSITHLACLAIGCCLITFDTSRWMQNKLEILKDVILTMSAKSAYS